MDHIQYSSYLRFGYTDINLSWLSFCPFWMGRNQLNLTDNQLNLTLGRFAEQYDEWRNGDLRSLLRWGAHCAHHRLRPTLGRCQVRVHRSIRTRWSRRSSKLLATYVIKEIVIIFSFFWFAMTSQIPLMTSQIPPMTSCPQEEENDGEPQMVRMCDTLFLCIITTLNQGVRNGGGIGDVLRRPNVTELLWVKEGV